VSALLADGHGRAALFGVFYTAVVVSQFVGMAQSSRDRA
jgi:hypothetical protein